MAGITRVLATALVEFNVRLDTVKVTSNRNIMGVNYHHDFGMAILTMNPTYFKFNKARTHKDHSLVVKLRYFRIMLEK